MDKRLEVNPDKAAISHIFGGDENAAQEILLKQH